MKKHLKLVIGVPSGHHWVANFGMDLGSLMVRFSMKQVPGYASQELRVVNVKSSILPKNRLDIIKAAKKIGADYLLFLDSDHSFPADLPHKLIAWDKPIVAANCVTKTIPSCPTARLWKEGDPQGEICYTDAKEGLEQVWRVGTGVMLIRKDALEAIPHSAWEMTYKVDGDTYQGEDWTFCEKCAELDIPIFVDHTVSRQVGHIGNFEFTHDYVGEVVTNAS
jgi:hypothetical protein